MTKSLAVKVAWEDREILGLQCLQLLKPNLEHESLELLQARDFTCQGCIIVIAYKRVYGCVSNKELCGKSLGFVVS